MKNQSPESNNISLTNSEWYVLECLWDEEPRTVMEVVNYLKEKVGWAKSTSITTLSRMEAKGLVTCDTSEKAKKYYSAVERNEAVCVETNSFLDKVYNGSVELMLSTLVNNNQLSNEEIQELYEILKKSE